MNQHSSDALSNAERRHLIEALFDFEAMPGRYPLTLREPRALFDRSHQVLLLAAGRSVEGLAIEPADAPRVQRAACFFVRMAMLRPGTDHYTLLGLPPDFQEDALRDHYRLLMRLTHPDFAGTANAWPGDAATRVNQANDVLSSRVRRAEYARQLASAAPRRIQVNSLDAVLPRTSRQHRPAAWGWGLAAGGLGALVLALMQWPGNTDDSELAQATQTTPRASDQVSEATQTVLTAAIRESREREPAPDAMSAQAAKAAKSQAAQSAQMAKAEQAAKARAAQAAKIALAEQAANEKLAQAAQLAQAEQAARVKAAQATQLAQAEQAAREKTIRAAQMAQAEQAAKAKAAQAAQLAQAEQAAKEKAVQTAVQVAKAEQAAKAAQAAQLAQAEQAAKAKAAQAAQIAQAEQAAKAQPARPIMAVALVTSPVSEPAGNPTLADAQLAMSQLIQAMQGGRGEELLRGLDRSVRQSEGATGLVNAYNLLVGDSRAVRLGPVQLRGHPNADQLVVDGIVQLVLHDQGQPPPVRELRLRAQFAQRGGQVVMTGLSTGGARP